MNSNNSGIVDHGLASNPWHAIANAECPMPNAAVVVTPFIDTSGRRVIIPELPNVAESHFLGA
jgi:hypothetical protein